MLKTVDLNTIISVSKKPDNLSKLKNLLKISLKDCEIETISALLNEIKNSQADIKTDGFILDYKIPQIGKEFDLLKLTDNFILNIELKSGDKSEIEIFQQLKKNEFYLSKTGMDYHIFTYHLKTNTLYVLENGKLITTQISKLQTFMNEDFSLQKNIDELFDPENYLVSPFNNVKRFIDDEYLLTDSQKQHKNKILHSSDDKNRFLITGPAGTGKTLLVYDIVKELQKSNNVYVIHGAKLNHGQEALNKVGFKIVPINSISTILSLEPDIQKESILVIDEVQRVNQFQLESFLLSSFKKIIFSGDPRQILKNSIEIGDSLIEWAAQNNFLNIKLNKKFRTNPSIAEFIKGLTDKKYSFDAHKINKDDITIEYFDNPKDLTKYFSYISTDWERLALPGSIRVNLDMYSKGSPLYIPAEVAFNVIGQEFTNVATLVGPNIEYSSSGKLHMAAQSSVYYDSALALFQNLTRTKRKIKLVIYDNPVILERILELLQ